MMFPRKMLVQSFFYIIEMRLPRPWGFGRPPTIQPVIAQCTVRPSLSLSLIYKLTSFVVVWNYLLILHLMLCDV